MGGDGKPVWAEFLETGVHGKRIEGVGMVYEYTLKVRPSDIFVLLKAKGGGGYMVHFGSARTLSGVAGIVRQILSGEVDKWREDRYAPT